MSDPYIVQGRRSDLKPIKLYTHFSGPNAWKIDIALRELGLSFERTWMEFADMKKEPYLVINPNGRVPAIVDPNTGVTLWESIAILQYLVATYDTQHKISFEFGSLAYFEAQQWLAFQASTQGPFMGQAAWFMNYHPDYVPSVIRRYQDWAVHVVEVIDRHLRTTGQNWIVQSKDPQHSCKSLSYVDIALIPWADGLSWVMRDREDIFTGNQYPHYQAWLARCRQNSSVTEGLKDRDRKVAESSTGFNDANLKASVDLKAKL